MTHWKRAWCWEELGAGGEGDNRGWDGWMASPTWWTWVWVDSGTWWWTGRPGLLRFMGSQRVGHDWANELNWLNESVNWLVHYGCKNLIGDRRNKLVIVRCLWSERAHFILGKVTKDSSLTFSTSIEITYTSIYNAMEQKKFSFVFVGIQNSTSTLEVRVTVFYKTKHTLTMWSINGTPWYLS